MKNTTYQLLLRLTLATALISVGACATNRSQPTQAKNDAPACTKGCSEHIAKLENQLLPPPIPASERRYSDVWERLSAQLSFLPLTERREVDKLEDWYSKHGHYMAKMSARAGNYIYHVVKELEARDMPIDLALLPFVESAYDPFAYSHGRAAGLWQFIPNTAKYVGIQQNWWYDGRRDVLVATDAALDYLTTLNKRFDGDWMLTLAAYNAGAGTVNRAIRRNRKAGKPTDFWSLKLPKETKRYVPKLLALVKIYQNPARYNISLPAVADAPRFEKVAIDSQIDLAKAAALADISVEELYRYNPGFNRWVTAPEGPHHLLIPSKQADKFKTRLAALPKEQRIAWQRYRVSPGDNLISIAKRHHIDIASIKRFNKLNGDMLRVGQELLIPASSQATTSPNLDRGIAERGRHQSQHIVRRGDTLSGIAQRHKVSVKQLIRWNRLDQGALIKPGQKLAIWKKGPSSGNGIVRKVGYKVRSGDSLSRIASRFKLKIADILEWNSIGRSSYLQPGQSLTLYVDVTRADL
ncbi:lytic transglycosylase [Spongiibacter marinus]|uniref:lytic transglycosylase n=1 Tax=Spongiibacter marinus TaxID=354246 RepID=UPI003564004D